MKKLLFLFCFFTFSLKITAQAEDLVKPSLNIYNKYLIKIDSNINYNAVSTGDYIKKICAAYSTTYNSSSKQFEVLTKKKLEYNIVSGKLQKNMTPLVDLILIERIEITPSVITNTVNSQ